MPSWTASQCLYHRLKLNNCEFTFFALLFVILFSCCTGVQPFSLSRMADTALLARARMGASQTTNVLKALAAREVLAARKAKVAHKAKAAPKAKVAPKAKSVGDVPAVPSQLAVVPLRTVRAVTDLPDYERIKDVLVDPASPVWSGAATPDHNVAYRVMSKLVVAGKTRPLQPVGLATFAELVRHARSCDLADRVTFGKRHYRGVRIIGCFREEEYIWRLQPIEQLYLQSLSQQTSVPYETLARFEYLIFRCRMNVQFAAQGDAMVAFEDAASGVVVWFDARRASDKLFIESVNDPRFKYACRTCGNRGRGVESKRLAKCGKCRVARYCSEECQHVDWPKHRAKECAHMKRESARLHNKC